MALCGFLSPEGVMHECDAWEHLDLALSLAAGRSNRLFKNRIEAEDYLYEQGFVQFNSRGASFRFKPYEGLHLTKEQRLFVEDNLQNANNEEQKADMEDILQWDADIKENSVLSQMEDKFLE